MRRIQTGLAALALVIAACGDKHDDGDKAKPAPPAPAPAKCPPGNAVQGGACVPVITADKIAAVAGQKSRIDDLARLLDQVNTVGAPIELVNGLRKLDQWQQLKAKVGKLGAIDGIADSLGNAVATLHTFQASLGEASGRLGNLKGQLDQLMTDTGAARTLDDVRGQVSTSVRATLEPLAAQVQDTIRNALVPLSTQLTKVSAAVIAGCAFSQLSGNASDQLRQMCTGAQDLFGKATAYVADLQTRPAALFNELTTQLESQLGTLVDGETKQALDLAQAKVNDALKLPPAPGSALGSGSGT